MELCVSGRSFLPNGYRVRSIQSTGMDVVVLCLFPIANNKDQRKENKERRSQLQW